MSQKYKQKELIVVNNAYNQFEASNVPAYNNKYVKVVDTPALLSYGMAINYGISQSNGEIIVLFDSNYLFKNTRIPEQVHPIRDGRYDITILGGCLENSFISNRLSINKNIVLSSLVIRRQIEVDFPNIDYNAESTVLMKLSERGFTSLLINDYSLSIKVIGHYASGASTRHNVPVGLAKYAKRMLCHYQ